MPDLIHCQPHVDDLDWMVWLSALQAPVPEVLVPANKVPGVSRARLLRGVFREDGGGEKDDILTGKEDSHHLQGSGVNAKIVNKPF